MGTVLQYGVNECMCVHVLFSSVHSYSVQHTNIHALYSTCTMFSKKLTRD